MSFAPTVSAHLSENDASATASEKRADDNTDHDYNKMQNQNLSSAEAHCDDFGGAPTSGAATTATVSCSQSAGDVKTLTSSAPVSISSISIGASSSWSELKREATGVVTTSHSEARSVDINGLVRIGYVASDATATATGVDGGATATYTRTFENVNAPGYSCTTTCDVSTVLKSMSDTLGAQLRVELPDFELLKTPGGGHAHAIRDPWQHQQDVVVNNQQTTESQVPALRIIYVADNATASRVMVELAGADASASSRPIGALGPCICPPPPPPTHPPTSYVFSRKIQAPTAVAKTGQRSMIQQLLTKLEHIAGHGWNLLFPSSPSGYARAALLWVILLAPIVLAFRRRELGGIRRLKP